MAMIERFQPAGPPRPGYVAPPPGSPPQRPHPLPGRGVGIDRQGTGPLRNPRKGYKASDRRGVDNKRQRYLNRLRRGPTNGQYARGGTKGPGGDYSGMYGGLTYQQLLGRINALRPGTKLPQRLPGGRPIVK